MTGRLDETWSCSCIRDDMRYASALGTLAVLSTLTALACSSESSDAGRSEAEQNGTPRADPQAGGEEKPVALGPREFRDDFFTYLAAEGGSEATLRKLVYLAPPEIESPPIEPGKGEDPVAPYDAHFTAIHPSALYEHGASQSPRKIADLEATFARSGAVHVVVVPGIFGEFIEDRPFEELLSRTSSSAARAWQRAASAAVGRPEGEVPTYSLAALATSPTPIARTVDVASLDDQGGNPLVTVAFLRPRSGSLETLGSIDESTQTSLARVDRYLALMGRPKNVVIMGYSRGAAVALDLVAAAAKDRAAHPWIDDVAGVVSLAGVLYGTALADATKDPNNLSGQLVSEITGLAAHLHSCDPSLPLPVGAARRTENIARWTGTLAKVAWITSQLPKHPELEIEKLDPATADLGRFASMVKRIVFDDALNLDKPLSDYCGNVERFKRLAAAAQRGVDSLTTASRLAWWRTHVLPPHVRLFSITATMGDATVGQSAWPFAIDPETYDTRSVDFKSLRANFYDLRDLTQLDLNDSQVTLPRARFWPAVHPVLNPAQPELRTYFMGTLGTHHWGLAFPRAFPTNDGLRGNPFPRITLMKTIGTFVSQAIATGDRRAP